MSNNCTFRQTLSKIECMKNYRRKVIVNMGLIFIVGSVYGQQPRDYVVRLTTSISESPAAISFKWDPIPGTPDITIWRKSKDVPDWGESFASLPGDATGYTDNTAETGV